MLSPRAIRKALMQDRGITTAEIAAEVGCHADTVRRVIDDENVYETDNTKQIKRLFASRVGFPIAVLWPEDEDPRTSRATDPSRGATEPGAAQ
jgi:lambda repressor-like predicted transcriptional regulator